MLATIAYRMLSKAVIRGAVCMSCVAGYDAIPIVDLRGQLPTAGEYPTRDLARINATVIHHTATRGQTIRSIADYHIQVKGWRGVAYHFAIGWDGTVYQLNGVDRKTNHAKDNNTHTIGVALVGNYDRNEPSVAMLQSAAALVAYLRDAYHAERVLFHRDLKATDCPGRFAVIALDSLHIR